MARVIQQRDLSPILAAANSWISKCLIEDRSMFAESLWTQALVEEVRSAFVEHPDFGEGKFMAKLKGQMKNASSHAKQLMAEMLWALLLFPSNVKAATKRRQVGEIWGLSGQQFAENHPLLRDDVLVGIGAGGLGFNIFKPNELEFLVELTCDLKRRSKSERRNILSNYDTFMAWIEAVLQKGKRQFRHMLRYFAFPDRVERMSSNNDRRKVLEGFSPASRQESGNWTDRQLDEALMALRAELQKVNPTAVLDFYEPPLRERWSREHRIETVAGPVTVTIPTEEDEVGDSEAIVKGMKSPEARESHQVQAKLAEIGAIIGFKIWIPRTDRARVQELMAKP